jgi:16S rRNA (guanine527-N7)-methyltransferase
MVAATDDMALDSTEWQNLVVQGAAELGVAVTQAQARLFAIYAGELLRWNARANLTRIVVPRQMALKHFVDSLAAAPLLAPGQSVLDIGAGAGFPGIVLKIVLPWLDLTLIDAVGKKVSFQQQIIRLLGLKGISALHVRAEEMLGRRPGGFHVAVCRAFADLATFWRLSAPLLANDGVAIAYKGAHTEGEIAAVFSQRLEKPRQVAITPYRLPVDGAGRTLVMLYRSG